jgi:hypothetical protein
MLFVVKWVTTKYAFDAQLQGEVALEIWTYL